MADAFAGYDVARLNFDGSNASTTMTDSLGHTFTSVGGAQLSTLRWGHGTSSLLLDNAGTQWVTSGNTTDWNFGSGDFCIDCFVNCASLAGGEAGILTLHDGTAQAFSLSITGGGGGWVGKARGTVWIGGVAKDITASGYDVRSSYDRRWQHLALTRKSGVLSVWTDGMLSGTLDATGSLDWNTNMTLGIGRAAAALPTGTPISFAGGIDMVRVTKGHYRYDKPFVPPVDANFNTYSSTVNVSSAGTNTQQIYINGATNHDAIIAGVDLAITNLGWSIYGSKYLGERTRVYRVLNKDGTTYKYAVLIWDTPRHMFNLTTCESWDQATRTMLNEVHTNNRAIGRMGYSFYNCDIFVFGTSRYLGMMTYVHTSPSQWAMVVENEREAPEDVAAAGYPCWGLINSADTFAGNTGVGANWGLAMPRTRDGDVGSAAKKAEWTTQLSYGAFGWLGVNQRPVESINSTSSSNASLTHAWDTAKKLVSSIRMIKFSGASQRMISTYGRLFGVKFCPPIGTTMDKVQLPIDADGFYAANGTLTDHWILPISTLTSSVTATTDALGSTATTSSSTGTALTVQCICFTGATAYVGGVGGVYKYDLASGVVGAVLSGTAQDIYDVAFDGRYVWATGATSLFRIDTASADAVTSTAMVGHSLALDMMGFVYVTSRTAATSPLIWKVDAQTMATSLSFNVASRVTSSKLACISHNGIDAAAVVCGNSATIADLCITYIPMGGGGATTYPIGTGFVGTEFGVLWAGGEWIAIWATAGAGSGTLYGYRITHNSGTSPGLVLATINPPMTLTAAVPNRIGILRAGCYQAFFYPSTTAFPVWSNAPAPDSGGGLAALTSLGSYATAGTRAMYFTGNSVLVATTGATNITYVRNLWRSTYSNAGRNNAHILIQR